MISGLPSTLDAGKGVPVSLRGRPSCGPDSEPTCPTASVPIRVLVRAASAPPPVNSTSPGSILDPDASGYSNLTLVAPSTAGPYVLYVWANASGYYGNTSSAFTALAPTLIQPSHQDLGVEELEGPSSCSRRWSS